MTDQSYGFYRLSPFDIESIEDEVMEEYGHDDPLQKFSAQRNVPPSRQRAMVFERLLVADEDQAFQVFRFLSEGFSPEEALERAEVPASRKNPSAKRPARRAVPRSLSRPASSASSVLVDGKPVRVLGSTRFRGGFGAIGLRTLVAFQGSEYEISTVYESDTNRFQTIIYSHDGHQLVVEEYPEGDTLEEANSWSFSLLPLAARVDRGDDAPSRENPERKPSKVQSVLIPKDRYTLREARKWIKEHKFADKGVDETERYYRFRQFAPTKHYDYRTIAFGQSGIKAVLRVSKKPR